MSLVTVLMSIYNEPAEWLKESIDSILNQSFKDFEFIIINDNPANAANVLFLNQYAQKDARIRIIENDYNIGLTKSLNKGLALAQGKYIARMDADDIAYPNRFELQYEFMEDNPECVLCGGGMDILQNDSIINTRIFPQNNDELKGLLFWENCIPHPTAFIRNKTLAEFDLNYKETYKYSQDYYLWCKLSSVGHIYNLSAILIKYRISEQQISTKKIVEQYSYANEIRKKHIEEYLKKNNILIANIENIDFNTFSAIKSSTSISGSYKRYILSVITSNLSILKSIFYPIFSLSVLLQKGYYIKSIKQSIKSKYK